MPVVSRSYVCAVLPPGAEALERALAAQDRPADAAVRARDVSAAESSGWVWFLDGTAVPRPDALAALLAAAERLESVSAPAVLASRVAARLLLGTALRPRERLRFGVELFERLTPRPSG